MLQQKSRMPIGRIGIFAELDLSNSQLKHLQQKTLEGFSKLKSLYLQNNRIKIAGFQLMKISHFLINIDMSGNKLMRIFGTIFTNLTNLKNLALQNCGLKTLVFPSDFQGLNILQKVSLSRNPLQKLFKNSFNNVCNLTSLVLNECKLQYISPEAFWPLTRLVALGLNKNNLTAKDIEVAFYGLRKTSTLETISLVELDLSDLNRDTFQHLNHIYLKRIDMRTSKITKLRSGVFQYLSYLERLDLSHNEMTNIEAQVFPKVNRLTHLILDSNQLLAIPDARSTQFENVHYLSIMQNAIQRISHHSLRNLHNLTYLNLKRNDISLLEKGCFNYSSQLQVLDLSYNEITGEINNDFIALQKLSALYLGQNNIANVTRRAFHQNPFLSKLTLNGNKLLKKSVNVLSEMWETLHFLQILDIRNLALNNLPLNIFHRLISLENLALSSNDLTGWNATVFKDLKNLKVLSITDNKITHISRDDFKYLSGLRELYLAKNPFRCTCELLSLVQWIENPRGLYFGGVEDYICESPKEWEKKVILEFNISEDDCQSYLWIDLIVAVGSIYMFLEKG